MVMAHSIFCIVSLSSYRLPDHLAWLICTPCKNYEGIRSCDPYYVERWKLLFLSICFKLRNHHAAAAKSLQSCLTLCDPRNSNPPGFPSPCLGFSRQEHWSGLPFTSLMHEGEKWKWSHSVMSDPQWPHGLQPTRLLCPWGFPGKSTGWAAIAFYGGTTMHACYPQTIETQLTGFRLSLTACGSILSRNHLYSCSVTREVNYLAFWKTL